MYVPSIEVQKITARIEELKAQRDKFISDANTQIVAVNAVIAELEALLKDSQEQGGPANGQLG